ncbi:ectoine/hydroxyectoine ABC transporter permease subunit EhuC [Paraburkholderia sp. CNPSo 3157]|uniref:Ectoine/hydroxyectoine ABC transporter permease subunit EhuC n=1 Tax=Paraburkholderia franconis TaxID=2654983 RepID=A0A7X1TIE5_9BURK|nr:ectoine/hydroxyectoine ABC transporter permease subunit EhuC [Paraburkholderia franconis]
MLQGTLVTLKIAVCAVLIAIFMAGIATVMRVSPWRIVRWAGTTYVEVFRGTSLLVQLFWLFFVLPLPPFNLNFSPFTVGIIGLGLNYGAYGSEILRGALGSVPWGQFEASVALNMTASLRMRRIILPQAMRNALPPSTNLMVELIKSTSLVSLITLSDLSFRASQVNSITADSTVVYGTTLVIYFVLAQLLVAAMRKVEQRTARANG